MYTMGRGVNTTICGYSSADYYHTRCTHHALLHSVVVVVGVGLNSNLGAVGSLDLRVGSFNSIKLLLEPTTASIQRENGINQR